MQYFAYGSNMSIARLTARVPSARALGCCALVAHDLRFHKVGRDGSGKCDAAYTANRADVIYGALFEMDAGDRPALDKAEGLGSGYEAKEVALLSSSGIPLRAFTYVATRIDANLRPYSWYLNHVLIGAREVGLPQSYIRDRISAVEPIEDSSRDRDREQRAIHTQFN